MSDPVEEFLPAEFFALTKTNIVKLESVAAIAELYAYATSGPEFAQHVKDHYRLTDEGLEARKKDLLFKALKH